MEIEGVVIERAVRTPGWHIEWRTGTDGPFSVDGCTAASAQRLIDRLRVLGACGISAHEIEATVSNAQSSLLAALPLIDPPSGMLDKLLQRVRGQGTQHDHGEREEESPS